MKAIGTFNMRLLRSLSVFQELASQTIALIERDPHVAKAILRHLYGFLTTMHVRRRATLYTNPSLSTYGCTLQRTSSVFPAGGNSWPWSSKLWPSVRGDTEASAWLSSRLPYLQAPIALANSVSRSSRLCILQDGLALEYACYMYQHHVEGWSITRGFQDGSPGQSPKGTLGFEEICL